MGFSAFTNGGHPHQPVPFPPFRVCHTPLPPLTQHRPPTAQRPTSPVGGIGVWEMKKGHTDGWCDLLGGDLEGAMDVCLSLVFCSKRMS